MKLDEYMEIIRKFGFTVQDFCLIHRISRPSIRKYLDGSIPHIDVAQKIVKATKGSVTLKDLGISE